MSSIALTQTDDTSLDPVLMDLITEALVWSPTADQRARVLAAIVDCAVEAIRWRLQPDGAPVEETSLLTVLQTVGDHHVRVRALS